MVNEIYNMMRPAIVVIGYNRINSMKRLLAAVEAADYPVGEDIPLIISIDRAADGSNTDVKEYAEAFTWTHGVKIVVYREENYGLKKHVLTCGDYSKEYGSVILLEDDLYVSPAFYAYACAALDYTKENHRIGGISLYNHRLNVHVREPFEALNEACDNWYFQFASSWGQAFTADQWGGFRQWLTENDGKDLRAENMPANVSGWSDKSWLKYYIKYLIETDRYFLYPTVSYTTNFAEEGTHAAEASNDLQVPLSGRRPAGSAFVFRDLAEVTNVYDAFYENKKLNEVLNLQGVLVDLYGYKPVPKVETEPDTEESDGEHRQVRYMLSCKSLPYKQVKSYGRRLRPVDANIMQDIPGEDFFLYDLSAPAAAPRVSLVSKLLYNYRAIKAKDMMKILSHRIKGKL